MMIQYTRRKRYQAEAFERFSFHVSATLSREEAPRELAEYLLIVSLAFSSLGNPSGQASKDYIEYDLCQLAFILLHFQQRPQPEN